MKGAFDMKRGSKNGRDSRGGGGGARALCFWKRAGLLVLLAACTGTEEPLEEIGQSLARYGATDAAAFVNELTVEDVLHLAVARNLDSRVKTMEEALAAGKAEIARHGLLQTL